ncbi:uncharacterized protein LOC110714415 [Chenopodium quinoa]|uniref:uncharacterized protein LOC110714415 n=1 Tax=Chenopodium quinoa TaxID=63459 RepID=UPI000B79ACCF|nr:uncharacterized protein LOC110714415 [Chenopodium quinoa]
MDVLHKRHIAGTSVCPICGNGEESIMHSLFKCRYAAEIWNVSDFCDLLARAPLSSFADRLLWMYKTIDSELLQVFAALTWAAWHCRNTHIYEGADGIQASMMAAGFVRLCADYVTYNQKIKGACRGSAMQSPSYWSPPPSNAIKVNVDAHLMNGSGVQFGAVIRDSRGVLLAAAVKKIDANWSPDLAEAGAARYGFELARRLGYMEVILECDALTVARAVSESSGWSSSNFSPV